MNYNAVPERGGQPEEQQQIIELGGVQPDTGGGVVADDQEHWALRMVVVYGVALLMKQDALKLVVLVIQIKT